MSVIAKKIDEGNLQLLIDNGDLKALEQVIERWNFKDTQSFWRFCVSVLMETEEKSIGIWQQGSLRAVMPASHSLKD